MWCQPSVSLNQVVFKKDLRPFLKLDRLDLILGKKKMCCHNPCESHIALNATQHIRITSQTFCTPLNTVLVSCPHPASTKALISHSGVHPSGKNPFASALTNNLLPLSPLPSSPSSNKVQKSGLIPYRSLAAKNNCRSSSYSTSANSPLK